MWWYLLSSNWPDINIILLFSNMTLKWCHWCHNIVNTFCSKWTSRRISHFRLHLRCDIALRNPFSQSKSTIVYICIYHIFRFKYSCFVYALSMIVPSLYHLYPLSVICVVFLWSVSSDKAYLNVLDVISKLLGQSTIRHASTTVHEYTCFEKTRLVASSKSIIREKINVIFVTIVNKTFNVWPYYFKNQHPSKSKW